MPVYEKLVRDLIPAKLKRLGVGYRMRLLDEDEFQAKLTEKLGEEAAEFQAATSTADKVEELADLLEVAYALAETLGGRKLIEQTREAKADARGGFDGRVLLVSTDD
jgi:predicted house-cleaning noncanonical NTP pyrophosphatase (MazG superfamily)